MSLVISDSLADKIIIDRIIPEKAIRDALHIAVAAYHEMSFRCPGTVNISPMQKSSENFEKLLKVKDMNSPSFVRQKN